MAGLTGFIHKNMCLLIKLDPYRIRVRQFIKYFYM